MPDSYEWARAFLEQAKIDLASGLRMYSTLTDQKHLEDPRRFYAVIVALSQQATEKAIKAIMFAVDDKKHMLDHNPLEKMWTTRKSRAKRELQNHNIIQSEKDKEYFCWLLQLAPGASVQKETHPTLDELLKQRNTEYPYELIDSNSVEIPWHSFTMQDIAKAKRIAGIAVSRTEGYLHKLELTRPIIKRTSI